MAALCESVLHFRFLFSSEIILVVNKCSTDGREGVQKIIILKISWGVEIPQHPNGTMRRKVPPKYQKCASN